MDGNPRIIALLGAVPSKILGGYYANDPDISFLIDNVLFEQLLPLSYPHVKSRVKKANGTPTAVADESGDRDPDRLRASRILLLVNSLDEKAQTVFFRFIQKRQVTLSKYVETYIQRCEDYNGVVIEADEEPIKRRLSNLITGIAKHFPEPGGLLGCDVTS